RTPGGPGAGRAGGVGNDKEETLVGDETLGNWSVEGRDIGKREDVRWAQDIVRDQTPRDVEDEEERQGSTGVTIKRLKMPILAWACCHPNDQIFLLTDRDIGSLDFGHSSARSGCSLR
ncbi:hypothetical protein FRC09_016085, partial [Ceratobasidium sp. 395]